MLMLDNSRLKLDATLGFDMALAAIPNLAERAEHLGFDGLWTSETRHDPFLPLALIAEHTSHIQFGSAVAVAFARSPTVMAHTAWDLAQQSRGRLVLGLGTQVRPHVERRFAATWSGRPVAQLRDYVAAVRAIWRGWRTGEPVRYRGSHYQITLMTPFFSPPAIADPDIPIYLAAVGPAMCGLAGEVGDGLMIHPLHSRRYLEDVVMPAVVAGAARTGRGKADLTLSGSVLVAIGEEGQEEVRAQIAFYASTPTYRQIMAVHGWQNEAISLSELARRGRWHDMSALVTDTMIDAFAVTGAWDDLADRLRDRYRGTLDRIALYRPFGAPADEPGWERLVADLQARGA